MSCRIKKKAYLRLKSTMDNMLQGKYTLYKEDKNDIYIAPRRLVRDVYKLKLIPIEYTKIQLRKKPLSRQKRVIDKLMTVLANDYGAILQCDTGFGKTYMSLYIALSINLPTIVICPNSKLVPQWANELKDMKSSICNRICVMDTVQSEYNDIYTATYDTAQFLFIRKELVTRIDVTRYKIIIVDEIHLTINTSSINALLACTGAIRVIGCTATMSPEAAKLYSMFCTTKDIILAKLHRPFNVYFVNLNIVCNEDKYLQERQRCRGRGSSVLVEYGKIETLLTSYKGTIRRIAKHLLSVCEDRKCIIICKHLKKCYQLGKLLEENYEYSTHKKANGIVTYLTGKDKVYDGYAPILIGTPQKLTVGFDQGTSGIAYDCKYDMVVVCDSIAKFNNVWQILGRVLRCVDRRPAMIWYYFPMVIFAKHLKLAKEELSKRLALCDRGKICILEPYENRQLTAIEEYDHHYKSSKFGLCSDRLTYAQFVHKIEKWAKDKDIDMKREIRKNRSIGCPCDHKSSTCIVKYMLDYSK